MGLEYRSHMEICLYCCVCPQVCLHHQLGIHDSCGVQYTFGWPGLLGGVAYIVQMVLRVDRTWNPMWVTWLTPLTPPSNSGRNVPRALSWSVRYSAGLREYLLADLSRNSAQPPPVMESSPLQATSFRKGKLRGRTKAGSPQVPQLRTEQISQAHAG